MPISRDLYTSNFASFNKGVSHRNADRIAQKNLSIVFTYTERLKELFIQINVRMYVYMYVCMYVCMKTNFVSVITLERMDGIS